MPNGRRGRGGPPRGGRSGRQGGQRQEERLLCAAPRYVDRSAIQEAPPGHRFGIYFTGWERGWRATDTRKREALDQCVAFKDEAWRLLTMLVERRSRLAASLPEDRVLSVTGCATAPFMTGLGREHPLENGFSFLRPYGLPYLAGSGVKGVLRDAAREVGLSGDDVCWLFGNEPPKHRRGEAPAGDTQNRGALVFWDVIPVPPRDGRDRRQMRVDVMTPHFLTYLEGKGPPHESDGPNPIPFLTLPVGTVFDFVVELRPPLNGREDALRSDWKGTLEACFERAFDFLGFGAKTAVGYGALERVARNGGGGGGPAPAADRGDPASLRKLLDELPGAPEQRVHEIFNRKRTLFGGSLLVELSRALLQAYERLGEDRFKKRVDELRRIIETGGAE